MFFTIYIICYFCSACNTFTFHLIPCNPIGISTPSSLASLTAPVISIIALSTSLGFFPAAIAIFVMTSIHKRCVFPLLLSLMLKSKAVSGFLAASETAESSSDVFARPIYLSQLNKFSVYIWWALLFMLSRCPRNLLSAFSLSDILNVGWAQILIGL